MGRDALLIIDMQNDFILEDAPLCVAQGEAIIPEIRKVLDDFRRRGEPVFHVIREHREDGSDVERSRLGAFLSGTPHCVPGTSGCEIVNGLQPDAGEYRLVKRHYSGFMNTELDFMLRRRGVERLVICGVQYPNCIRMTAFDGMSLGYDVTVITDACGAQTKEIAAANILDMKNIGVECMSVKSFLG